MDAVEVAAVGQDAQAEQAREDPAIITEVGVAAGEVLLYLDEHGATPVRRVIRELACPAPITFMAMGALVREGLVRAVRHDLEVILEPCHQQLVTGPVPEVWGG